jgi:hypothetical protein
LDEAKFDLGAIRADRLAGERRVQFTVSSSSLQDEELSLVAPDEWQDLVQSLSPADVPAAGSSEFELTLALPTGLQSGDYQATLQLVTREDVTLTPETLAVSWSVQPVPWTARYGLALAGAGVLLLALLGAVVVWRARIQRPWGVLVPLRVPPGALELEHRLHQGDWRGRVVVGSAKGCQVCLAHPSVRPQHALVLVQKQTVTEPVGRPPRPVTMTRPVCLLRNLGDGLVQVGGARLLPGQTSPPLKRGTRVKLGDFEFEWREA